MSPMSNSNPLDEVTSADNHIDDGHETPLLASLPTSDSTIHQDDATCADGSPPTRSLRPTGCLRRLCDPAGPTWVPGDRTLHSHNYEPDESAVWRAHVAEQHAAARCQRWTAGQRRALKRWGLTLVVGIVQAGIAVACNRATLALGRAKYGHVYALLERGADDPDLDGYWFDFWRSPFLAFLCYQTTFALLATLFVYVEPVGAGSGIPEVKCYLNGINLPRVMRVKTLLCKVLGVTFSVAAGLPVGKEGPMVHSGSIVAAGISQGRTKVCGVGASCSKIADFRNDHEKRDFVACGAAAGVASAFGAPIGGVLFALEEGASYWSAKLTWRAFFCAMVTIGTLLAMAGLDQPGSDVGKLFSFGEFTSLREGNINYAMWELALFLVVGCLGGAIGACFNAGNKHLTIWRMKNVNHSKARRVVEVLLVSVVVTTVSFSLPLLWGKCTALPTDMSDFTTQQKELVAQLIPFKCDPRTEYNEVASLIFCDANVAIRQLFHFRETGPDLAFTTTFSINALLLFFVPYLTLASVTYGIAVPSGLFVPSLLAGAAFGRLCGHFLHRLDWGWDTFADSGTYALVGAAAVLGGMARMTISLTVILLEATGNMQYVLPLMVTLMAARFTGNVFNKGLYDIHIHLKHIPFLEPEVPASAERHDIVAGQVMSKDVKRLRPVERVSVVFDLLQSVSHSNFPIVDPASSDTLYGTASRSTLCTLLQRRAFVQPDDVSNRHDHSHFHLDAEGTVNCAELLGQEGRSPLVSWDAIESVYPRYPTIDNVQLRPEDRDCWIDLRPYANTAPYTVNESASIQRTYRLFRTLALRFLCVVNHNNQVVGIISRTDLLPESLSESIAREGDAHMTHDGAHCL